MTWCLRCGHGWIDRYVYKGIVKYLHCLSNLVIPCLQPFKKRFLVSIWLLFRGLRGQELSWFSCFLSPFSYLFLYQTGCFGLVIPITTFKQSFLWEERREIARRTPPSLFASSPASWVFWCAKWPPTPFWTRRKTLWYLTSIQVHQRSGLSLLLCLCCLGAHST